jgi:predicted Zn-dependent protease
MATELQQIIEKALKFQQIEEYEIYITERNYYENIFLKNQIDNERQGSDIEYTIRVLTQQDKETGIGVAKGNSMHLNDIKRSIDLAVKISKQNIGSKYHFPTTTNLYGTLSLAEQNVLKDPLGVKNQLSEELLYTINEQKNVSPTFGRFRIHIDNLFLKNSNGLNLDSKLTSFFVECALKAQNSTKLSEYWPYLFFKNQDQLKFNERIPKWAKLANDTLNAKAPVPKRTATVIFSPQLIENALFPVLNFHSSAKAYQEKMTRFNPEHNIASNNLTIIDNGLMPGGLHSNSWDGEGNPRQSTIIVREGLFKNRLYDQKYALLENKQSTGNGIRAPDGSISNGITNLEILPGNSSLDDIISEIKEGYLIENCAWLNPSPLTGDFGTLISNGYYIENGKIQYAVQGGNVSGNALKMLKECEIISKERDIAKNCLLPYIAFSGLTISY